MPFTVGRGARRSIEVCDLLSDGRQLVHVKRETRSSTLSHLFAQGRISASALKGDRPLRDRVRAHLATLDPSLPALVPEPFRAQDYEVVYAVVAPNAALLPDALPFFSKLNLVHSVELVGDALEFRVSFLGIPHLGS